MSTPLIIEPSPELQSALDERARQTGKSVPEIAREILEASISTQDAAGEVEDAEKTLADFEAGLADLDAGRSTPAQEVLTELRARYELLR